MEEEVLFVGTAEAEHAEMYIKAVWHINEAGGSAKAADIAKKLNVRQPSVTHMVRKLKHMNLVNHSRIDGVSLTPDGERMGAKMVRNSRLLEVLMESALKMEIDEEMVCGVEHHMSPRFTDALCTLLGHPGTSPHGRRIPPGPCCGRAAPQ